MNITSYIFESNSVRVAGTAEAPLFAAKDACLCLELKNSRQALASIPTDEKDVTLSDTLGGGQQIAMVTESGLYRLIFKSRKPAAKRFQKWIFSEVIPSLRKIGSYTLPSADAGPTAPPLPPAGPAVFPPRVTEPDIYYAPVLSRTEIMTHISESTGQTRARFIAFLSELREVNPTVAESMIDSAIHKQWLNESVEGRRLHLRWGPEVRF